MTTPAMLDEHSGLIYSMAKRYYNKSVEFDDLIQAGNLGLLEAAQRFDPERGVEFSTYAYYWIRKCIKRAVATEHIVILPASVQGTRDKIAVASQKYCVMVGSEPTQETLGKLLGESEEDIAAVQFAFCSSCELDDKDGSVCPQPDIVADKNAIISSLSEPDRSILRLRIEGYTLKEIGEEFELSRERVRQRLDAIISRLRKRV